MHRIGVIAAATCLAFGGMAASAQDKYPSKPIHVIVPLSAGSATDIVPRLIMEHVSAEFGQTIVVENRVGAGGTLGTAAVARAAPDGYTLLATSSAFSVSPSLYSQLGYDTEADFKAIIPFGNAPTVLVVAPSKGWKTIADVTAAAKAKPGTLTYASAGIGTGTHLAAERYIASAGIKAVHVPFKGGPEALTEVLTGRVDFMFGALASAYPHIRSGALVPLAVSTQKRLTVLPDVPTTEEAGYPDSHYNVWLGLLAPAKTPPAIIETLRAAVAKAMALPDVQVRLKKLGMEPLPLSPAEFDAQIRQEIAANQKIIANAGIKKN
ncbi:MAG: Bug family tripartite tricarboxylate transporter substrate binding protein [Pseudolabrys sp.]